jgi:hypothetical protein
MTMPAALCRSETQLGSGENCSAITRPGSKHFLPVQPQSGLSFLFLLGRTQVRLRPLLYQVSGYRQICFRPAEASPAQGFRLRLKQPTPTALDNHSTRSRHTAIPLRAVPAPVVQKRKLLKVHHIRTTYDGLQLRRRLSV